MKKFERVSAFGIFLYVTGFLITTLGINLIIRSDLGAGPWDTVSYNLSVLLNVTLGMASAIVSIAVMSVIIFIRKQFMYLIGLIPAFSIALMLDFWDNLVFGDYFPSGWVLKGVFFIIGVYFITLGLATIVSSGYPAMLYEELTLALMKVFNIKRFAIMRLMVESFAIALATVFGFMAGIGFGVVSYGSILIAFTIAPILDLQIKFIAQLRNQKVPKG